jgi:hypothetical protein
MPVFLDGQLLENILRSGNCEQILGKIQQNPQFYPSIRVIPGQTNTTSHFTEALSQKWKQPDERLINAKMGDALPCDPQKILHFHQGEGVLISHDDPQFEASATTATYTCAQIILRDEKGNYFHCHYDIDFEIPWHKILAWFAEKKSGEAIKLEMSIVGAMIDTNDPEFDTKYIAQAGYLFALLSLINANQAYPHISIHITKHQCFNKARIEKKFLGAVFSSPIFKDILVTKNPDVIYEVSTQQYWKKNTISDDRLLRTDLVDARVQKQNKDLVAIREEILKPFVDRFFNSGAVQQLSYPAISGIALLRTIGLDKSDLKAELCKWIETDNFSQERAFYEQIIKKKQLMSESDFPKMSASDPQYNEETEYVAKKNFYRLYLYLCNSSIYAYLIKEYQAKRTTDRNIQLLKEIVDTFSTPQDQSKAYSTLGSFYRERWLCNQNEMGFYHLAEDAFFTAITLDSKSAREND